MDKPESLADVGFSGLFVNNRNVQYKNENEVFDLFYLRRGLFALRVYVYTIMYKKRVTDIGSSAALAVSIFAGYPLFFSEREKLLPAFYLHAKGLSYCIEKHPSYDSKCTLQRYNFK